MKLVSDRNTNWKLWGVLLSSVKPVACGSIATWWYSTLSAPQVIQYDNATGQIYYSLCNSNSTPVFPGNDTAAFPLDLKNFPPMNGTSVAATGYESDGKNIAAIFYQTENSVIAHALFTCNDTGHYYFAEGQQTWDLTTGLKLEVQNQTGLAALNVVNRDGTKTDGFRVYYKDTDSHTRAFAYNPDIRQWYADGYVSQAPSQGPHVSAGYIREDELTVISSDQDDFLYADSLVSGVWNITTFPVKVYFADDGDNFVYPITNQSDSTNMTKEAGSWSLDSVGIPSGSAGSASTGLSMDSASLRSVFYIGENRDLYHVKENSSFWGADSSEWVVADRQPTINWPAADVEYADIATTFHSDSNQTWIYYISSGTMTQVYQSGTGKWQTAIALPKFNSTPATEATAGTGDATPNGGNGPSSDTGLAVGLGVGLPIGFGAIAVFMFYRGKKLTARKKTEKAAADAAHLATTSPLPGSVSGMTGTHSSMLSSAAAGYNPGYWEGGYWADGQWIPAQGQTHYTQEGEVRFNQSHYADTSKPMLSHPVELPIIERRQEVSGDGISEMAATASLAGMEEPTKQTTGTEPRAELESVTMRQTQQNTTMEDQPHAR